MATTLEPVASVERSTQTGSLYGISAHQILDRLAAAIDPARILIRPIERIAFASDASF